MAGGRSLESRGVWVSVLVARAAVTRVLRTGRFTQQTFVLHDSGGRKSEIEVSAGLVPSEASVLSV